ncbi:substance-K receptor-like protein [Leptotrombidium deliense]|uniref:Substance-K receptor-like protein n=1 Tax=Leptotrombidium deliense TaxID=299467 RepID=A0A443STI6_9ACAR|nr:substance-K receptor-like protein [Leptotrombidium deliense]
MATVWITSLLISVPLLVRKHLKTREWCDFVEIWCAEDVMLRSYWLALISLLVYVPVLVMITVYAVILFKMKTYEERLGKETSAAILDHRRKIIRMLFFYLINAAVCWLPLQIIVFYRFLYRLERIPKWMSAGFFVGHLFVTANSAINPIIYGFANKSFRTYIFKIHPKLFRILGQRPAPSMNRVTPINRTPLCALYIHRSHLNEQRRKSKQLNSISLQLARRRSLQPDS